MRLQSTFVRDDGVFFKCFFFRYSEFIKQEWFGRRENPYMKRKKKKRKTRRYKLGFLIMHSILLPRETRDILTRGNE